MSHKNHKCNNNNYLKGFKWFNIILSYYDNNRKANEDSMAKTIKLEPFLIPLSHCVYHHHLEIYLRYNFWYNFIYFCGVLIKIQNLYRT